MSGPLGTDKTSSKTSRKLVHQVTKDQVAVNTRQVVLDFLSLVPSNAPSLNTSSGSSSQDASPRKKLAVKSNSVQSAGAEWKERLDSLPEVKLIHKYDPFDKHGSVLTPQPSEEVVAQVGYGDAVGSKESKRSPGHTIALSASAREGEAEDREVVVAVDETDSSEEDTVDVIENSLHKFERSLRADQVTPVRPSSIELPPRALQFDPSRPSGSRSNTNARSPSKYRAASKAASMGSLSRDPLLRQGAVDRQSSHCSDMSDMSDASSLLASFRSGSTRSNLLDIQNMDETDLGTLVKSKTLPPLTIPLQKELAKERERVDKEFKERSLEPMTPQTEVALLLSIIGDRVDDQYAGKLQSAVQNVIDQPSLNYDVLDAITAELVGAMPSGWRKASLLLVFGQKLAYGLIGKGKGLGHLVDYISKILENQMADFIIDRGGWQSISALEDMSPVSPSDILPDYNPSDSEDGYDIGPDIGPSGMQDPNRPEAQNGHTGDLPGDQADGATDVISPEAPSQADSAIYTDNSHGSPAKGAESVEGGGVDRDPSLESLVDSASGTTGTESSASTVLQLSSPPRRREGAGRGGESTDVSNVLGEIHMMRQISKEFPNGVSGTQDEDQWRLSTTLGVTGAVLLCGAAYMLYKKVRK